MFLTGESKRRPEWKPSDVRRSPNAAGTKPSVADRFAGGFLKRALMALLKFWSLNDVGAFRFAITAIVLGHWMGLTDKDDCVFFTVTTRVESQLCGKFNRKNNLLAFLLYKTREKLKCYIYTLSHLCKHDPIDHFPARVVDDESVFYAEMFTSATVLR